MLRLFLQLLISLSFPLVGCAPAYHEVQTVRHFGREAVRLSNGTIEVVVIPSLGRIIHFSFVGEKNVLWENPMAVDTARLNGGWENWGGDKVWLWPQADWSNHFGKSWPPPGDPAGVPPEIRLDNLKLKFRSPPIDPVGLRIVREIELNGSSLRVVSRLEPEHRARELKLRPWTVTQLTVPNRIYAELIDGIVKRPFCSLPGQSPWPTVYRSGNSVTLERPPDVGAKVGLEADHLIADYRTFTFNQKLLSSSNARYAPCERAQVYSDPDESSFRQKELPPYIEFEFVAPQDSAMVEVIWTLGRK
jgi:hypothetical protein